MALKTNIATPAANPTATANPTYGDIEKIGKLVVVQAKSRNPLNVFDAGYLPTGKIWEELGIPFVASTETPATGTSAFGNKNPELPAFFYQSWNKRTYQTTVSDADMRAIILANMAADDMAEKLTASLTESEGDDDYNSMLAVLKDEAFKTAHPAEEVTTNTDDLLRRLRTVAKDMTFANDKYYSTAAKGKGWKSSAALENIYILIPTTVLEMVNISTLSKLFNLTQAEMLGKIVEIDTTDNLIYIVENTAIGYYSRLRDFRMGFNYTTGKDEAFLYTEKQYFWSGLRKAHILHYNPTTTA